MFIISYPVKNLVKKTGIKKLNILIINAGKILQFYEKKRDF